MCLSFHISKGLMSYKHNDTNFFYLFPFLFICLFVAEYLRFGYFPL